MTTLSLRINGVRHEVTVEDRWVLADVLREKLGLTGTHLGCEHGVCGSCTVLVDGEAVRSCLMLAVQAAGHEIRTVEGLADADGTLDPLQQAFSDEHALQCGFCTSGFLMLARGALDADPSVVDDDERLQRLLTSNLCRCTGYVGIRRAVITAAGRGPGPL